MTDTFDWAGLAHEAASIRYTHGDPAAAAYLRTRIEAAFVPVAAYTATAEAAATHLKGKIEATARAQAAEAENARLRAVIQHRGGPLCPARYSTAAECNCGVTAALGADHGK